jgi:putative ABC transport system permease protein
MFLTIASVSLLVGGIGIMNIMLASVTERTREIGIRRALGAKRADIVAQFLIEAVSLTTIGGLLGILIGLIVPWAVEKMLSFTTIISASTLILPFAMAVLVGLVSGLYPALRAARLDPIVALRHE